MLTRFNQIDNLITDIDATILAEIGIGDFSVTEKLIGKLINQKKIVTYFGLGNPDFFEKYQEKLLKIKIENHNFNFFLIDFLTEINIDEKYNSNGLDLKLLDAQVVVSNIFDDEPKLMNFISLFNNSSYFVFNNLLHSENIPSLKNSINNILTKVNHIVLPIYDTVLIGEDLANSLLAVTGQKIKNQNVKSNNQISIKTKNAVPNEKIQKNVEENILFAKAMGIKEIMPCQIHNGVAYMIGGAQSYKTPEKLKMIKKAIKEPNHYIFSSKTALPFLLETHIKPYACILLDPREHIPTFVDKINKDVIYFVASQCDTATLPSLVSQGAKVFLYHAAVNAGEADVLKKLKSNSPLVGGGSTSVTRGIGLLQIMGFHQFKLFGLDSSYPVKPEKVHGYNQEKPAIEVNMSDNVTKTEIGQKYWTDPELIAQCNDIEMIMKNWLNIKLENYSEGMMADMFKHLLQHRRRFKDFTRN